MIFDTLETAEADMNLGPLFKRAFQWLRDQNLAALEPGRHEILEGEVFALVQEKELKPAAELKWEAHRVYADIQYLMSGTERMDCAPLGACRELGYDASKDFVSVEAPEASSLRVGPGEFAVFFPRDAHKPGILPEGAAPGSMVRKLVVKVRMAV